MSLASALTRVYGEGADAQQVRYRAALASFARTYGPGPVLAFRAPGRVNLIGEHTDYNHGFVLPVALDRDVLLLARARSDATVYLRNVEPEFAPRVFPIGPNVAAAPPGDWSNYARGAAQMVARQLGTPGSLHGIDALVAAAPPHGTPRGAGVSSSSALTVAAALALAHVNGWQPDAAPFAHLCSQAEWFVGTRGGIMDQFIALLARPDHALFLDCRPAEGVKGGTRNRSFEQRYTFAHVPFRRVCASWWRTPAYTTPTYAGNSTCASPPAGPAWPACARTSPPPGVTEVARRPIARTASIPARSQPQMVGGRWSEPTDRPDVCIRSVPSLETDVCIRCILAGMTSSTCATCRTWPGTTWPRSCRRR